MSGAIERHVRRLRDELRAVEIPEPYSDRLQPLIDGLTPIQRLVHDDPSRFRIVIAGRRSGKTRLGVVELLTAAIAKPGSMCWYVAPSYRQAERAAWLELKRLTPPSWMIGLPSETDLSMTLANGSSVALRGADNYDSLRGVGLDFLVLDEFAWIHTDAWSEVLRPSLADRQGRALFTTTPAGLNWAYDLVTHARSAADWAVFEFTTEAAGIVTPEEIAAARESLDPRAYRQEFLGSFESLSGRVYSNFSRAIFPLGNVDATIVDTGGEILVGQDFNVNPMASVIAVKVRDECHVLDSLEVASSNTEEVAAEIKARYPNRRIIVCPDPSGRARKTSAPVGQTDFTILARHGFQVRAPSVAPPLVDRINNTQSMLVSADSRRKLRLHPCALSLIRGLDGLVYKPGTSQVDKSSGLEHVTDALGYLLWQEFNLLQSARARVINLDAAFRRSSQMGGRSVNLLDFADDPSDPDAKYRHSW